MRLFIAALVFGGAVFVFELRLRNRLKREIEGQSFNGKPKATGFAWLAIALNADAFGLPLNNSVQTEGRDERRKKERLRRIGKR